MAHSIPEGFRKDMQTIVDNPLRFLDAPLTIPVKALGRGLLSILDYGKEKTGSVAEMLLRLAAKKTVAITRYSTRLAMNAILWNIRVPMASGGSLGQTLESIQHAPEIIRFRARERAEAERQETDR